MVVSVQDYALLSVDAYNDYDPVAERINNWERLNISLGASQVDSDFSAAVYEKGNEIVISYRGTDALSELLSDSAQIAAGIATTQILDAYNYYMAVASAPENQGKTITFTGHSLGGALAAIMSAHTGLAATVFSPAGYQGAANEILDGEDWLDPLDETGTTLLGSIPPSTNTSSPFANITSELR